MTDKVILAVIVAVVVLVFNIGLYNGIRKSRRTTRMFKVDQLYEKYENEALAAKAEEK